MHKWVKRKSAHFGEAPDATHGVQRETTDPAHRRFTRALAVLGFGVVASVTAGALLSVTDGLFVAVISTIVAVSVELYFVTVESADYFSEAVQLQREHDRDPAVGSITTALLRNYSKTLALDEPAFSASARSHLAKCDSELRRLAGGNMRIDRTRGILLLMEKLKSPQLRTCCAVNNARIWSDPVGEKYNALNIERAAEPDVTITRIFIEDDPLAMSDEMFRTLSQQSAAAIRVFVVDRASVDPRYQHGLAVFDDCLKMSLDSIERPRDTADRDDRDGWRIEMSTDPHEVATARETVQLLELNAHGFEEFAGMRAEAGKALSDRTRVGLRSSTAHWVPLIHVRTALVAGFRNYLTQQGSLEVRVPVLADMRGACENVASVVSVADGSGGLLIQTGQLALERALEAAEQVWCHTGSFRNEHVDERHLREFELLEEEFTARAILQGNSPAVSRDEELYEALMKRIEMAVRTMIQNVMVTYPEDLIVFGQDARQTRAALDRPFARVSYEDALALLAKDATTQPLAWGANLERSQEIRLVSLLSDDAVERPVFVTRFPEDTKYFNMKLDRADPRVVLSADLLLPGVGEAVGAAVREDDYTVLRERFERLMKPQLGPDGQAFAEYLDTVRRARVGLHAGYGMGLERVMQYLLGEPDIRRVSEPVLLTSSSGQ